MDRGDLALGADLGKVRAKPRRAEARSIDERATGLGAIQYAFLVRRYRVVMGVV
jgi:hypothetical protein